MRKAFILGICFLLVGLFLYNFYHVFKKKVYEADIKGFAEQKVGEIFDARIKIGDIKVGLLKYISLSGLEINQNIQDKLFYLVDVKKIIFRYDLLSFFKTNVAHPNKVSLYTPSIEFRKFKIPNVLFTKSMFAGKANILFEVRDGSIRYDIPNIETKFSFKDISGTISPLSTKTFMISFEAHGSDGLTGTVSLTGICNTQNGTCDLDVAIKDSSVISSSFVPIKGLKGRAHVTNDTITIKDISFYIRDIPVRVKGTIKDFETDPVLDLKFTVETQHFVSGFTIFGNIDDLKIKGNVHIAGTYHYLYHGSITLQEDGFLITDAVINDEYSAHGRFSFQDGQYNLTVGKGKQEVTFDFMHENYNLSLDLALQHISFLNYDFVTVGRLKLEPALQFWTDNKLIMNASIETDYMIFNYTPLNDFRGTFTISPRTISKMDFTWGDVYSVTGELNLDKPRSIDVVMSVDGLDLSNYESLGGIQLADGLETIIQGRVNINGPMRNPQIEGFIRSEKGQYREFIFDKAAINFYGDRYILDLKDSKMYRNDKVYYMRGKIDFTKKNVFHDVLMESSEKIILWHGWDLSKNVGDDTIKVKHAITDDLDLSLRGKYGGEYHDEEGYSQGASLEYEYNDDQSLSVSFEDAENDETVALKHSIQF